MALRFLSYCATALISAAAVRAQTVHPLPLGFESTGSGFRAHAQDYTVDVDATGASLRLPDTHVLRLELEGAAGQSIGMGSSESAGVANYLIGNDPSLWRRNVPQYSRVKYSGVYPGIDLVYYGQDRKLEFDVVVAPGADPGKVRLHFEGSDRIRTNRAGGLLIDASGRKVELQAPVVYQMVDGARVTIPARFVRRGARGAGLRIAAYDRGRTLVIDPAVTTTYIGGSRVDTANAITVDAAGSAYVVGGTDSTDFPVTPGALSSSGLPAAFIVKFNSTGVPVYSTYIGGSNAYAVAVDAAGDAYMAGVANSHSFPVTAGAFQAAPKGVLNGFALKLNPAGSGLIYATLFGGSGQDEVTGLAVDPAGNAFVVGYTTSQDFPTTAGAVQPKYGGGLDDGFLTKINATGTGLAFSTYMGTPGRDEINGVALDGSGSPYFAGLTDSLVFPASALAYQKTNNATQLGGVTGFVSHISSDGSTLLSSTYLGGTTYDFGQAVTAAPNGNIYVTGGTASQDFPVTPGAVQARDGGVQAVFVTELDPLLSHVLASTYFGGSFVAYDAGYGIAVGTDSSVYVAGQTGALYIPGATAPPSGNDLAFVAAFSSGLTAVAIPAQEVTSSPGYVSGLALDPVNGKAWMSLNGQGGANATNAPKAPLATNMEPPAVGWLQTVPAGPITVSKKLVSPAGDIHQGDQLVFQLTITNVSTTVTAMFGFIDDVTLGVAEQDQYRPLTEFLKSTAPEVTEGGCDLEAGATGQVRGYVCGYDLGPGKSIVITDTYHALISGFSTSMSDTNTVQVDWSTSAHTQGTTAAKVSYSILPPPASCGVPGSSRVSPSADTFGPSAAAGSCPVSGTTPQTIDFPAIPGQKTGAAPVALSATATSHLTVSYDTADDTVCSVAGSTVTIAGNGGCIITAEQPGNATYAPASSISRSFSVTDGSVPVIGAGGIGPVFSSSTTVQAGSWMSIYGSNLASAAATWNGDFPTSLGGVTVTINGRNAYLWYVSPTQINLQAPDDTATGVVPVTVTNATGSWTSAVTLGPVSPSFLLLDGKHVTGIILRSDGSGAYGGGTYDILGPTGTSLGYKTVAAKTGDRVELFGVGFGPTSPVVPAGQAFSGAAATTNPVELAVGGAAVTPSFAGLSSAGLYQINVTVPAGLGTGDLALAALVGGMQTQSGVLISLQ